MIAFIKKEFLHIRRDWRSLLVLIGMPVAQIMLFGFAITNEIQDARIAILDKSKDEHTQQIIQKVTESGFFVIENYLQSDQEVEPTFKEGVIKQVIVFEPQFGVNLEKGAAHMQVIADASDPNTATLLNNYVQAIARSYQQELNQHVSLPVMIEMETTMLYNQRLKGVYMFVPGLICIILMLISAMMTSISITKEKEMGTMEILLVTPMTPAQVIISKVIPYLFLAFFDAVLILFLGYYVFEVPIRGSLVLLLAESSLFIGTALSLGVLISTRTSSQQVALMISLMGLMLPTILLSGFIFPVENMPIVLQVISNAIPAKWFVIIVKNILLKGLGFASVWKETLILCGFTLFFIALSVKNYKLRLE